MMKQQLEWGNEFGTEYTKRNMINPFEMDQLYKERYGTTRTEINMDYLDFLDRDAYILEVGSNIGNQLHLLSKMGFKNLYGIEINPYAISISNKNNEKLPIYVIQGDALDIPFKDNYFDVVFTSAVLIHISPTNITRAIDEIYRCSKKYIWAFEFYHEGGYKEIIYRNKSNMLWKTDFKKLFLENFSDLHLVKEDLFSYKDSPELFDQMFLLKKG